MDAGIHTDAVNHVSPAQCSHHLQKGKASLWSCSRAQSNSARTSAAVGSVLMEQYPRSTPSPGWQLS